MNEEYGIEEGILADGRGDDEPEEQDGEHDEE